MTIKKKIILFMCMMITIIMTSTMAFATTKNEYGQVYSDNYNQQYIGSSSEFWAKSYEYDTVYTTLENTSTSTKYLLCQVREYTANIGWTGNKTVTGDALPGIQLNAVYEGRDVNMVGYYYHHGKCYMNSYSGYILDTYTYKACQRYIP